MFSTMVCVSIAMKRMTPIAIAKRAKMGMGVIGDNKHHRLAIGGVVARRVLLA